MKSLNAAIQYDGKWYVAKCLALPVISQGFSIAEAKQNLTRAIKRYLLECGAEELLEGPDVSITTVEIECAG